MCRCSLGRTVTHRSALIVAELLEPEPRSRRVVMIGEVSIDRTAFMTRDLSSEARLTSVGGGKVRSLKVSMFTRVAIDSSLVIDGGAGAINSLSGDSRVDTSASD